jgi:hypothetical protein
VHATLRAVGVAAALTLVAAAVALATRPGPPSAAPPAPAPTATPVPAPAPTPASPPDIDGDGIPDPVEIVGSTTLWGVVAHLSHYGDRYAWRHGSVTGTRIIGVADLNRDGRPEIVVRTASNGHGQSYGIVTMVPGALVWARGAGRKTPATFYERSGPWPLGWGCIDASSVYETGDVYQVALNLTEAPVRAYGTLNVYRLRDGILTFADTWGAFWHPRTEAPPREYSGGLGCGL